MGLSNLREKVPMLQAGAETGRLQALHAWARVCQGRPEELGAYVYAYVYVCVCVCQGRREVLGAYAVLLKASCTGAYAVLP